MDKQFVNIPVPADRVDEVYAVLGRAKAPAAPIEAKPEDIDDAVGAQPGALDEALIIRAYRESPPAMVAVFDYLASHPSKDVGMGELAKGVGTTPKRLSGALGAYGRRKKYRYHQTDAWPFKAWWDYVNGHAVYHMSGEVAAIIKKA